MLAENKGLCEPVAVSVEIDRHWRILAEDESRRRQARDNSRSDKWGKGLCSNPHYIGILAECAIAHLLGVSVDFSFGYDRGFDFVKHGLKYDVKATKQRMPLVKKLTKQRCHRFIFCRVLDKTVDVLGWISYCNVLDKPLQKRNFL